MPQFRIHASAIALTIALSVQCAFAGASRLAAQDMVDSAVALAMQRGPATAIASVLKGDPAFNKGELYVFVYDTNGMVVAHARNPKLVGKNVINLPDVQGKPFRRRIIETAMSDSGCGWVDYLYENPLTGRIERKDTWVRRLGRYVFCCGVYVKN